VALRLAIDTNRYTDLCRGDRASVEVVELADEVWLPFIVIGELWAGFAVGSQGSATKPFCDAFC
jgi:predicted nucleic acid-binding protein